MTGLLAYCAYEELKSVASKKELAMMLEIMVDYLDYCLELEVEDQGAGAS